MVGVVLLRKLKDRFAGARREPCDGAQLDCIVPNDFVEQPRRRDARQFDGG